MLPEDKNSLEWIHVERTNIPFVGLYAIDELLQGAVADAEPDDFGWVAVKQTALLKVGVLRDDGKAIGTGIIPNILVGKAKQPTLADVRALGK